MNWLRSTETKRNAAPLFTIFTPTYNRAHTLHRAFESLSAQTLADFEWIVVDDGSTDGTAHWVAGWMKSAQVSLLRYLRQNHSGKHIAHNLALGAARGKFFTCLDSDYALVPDALEKVARHWDAIPENLRPAFCGVDGLCCDQHGNIVGYRYPSDPLDADLREIKYVYRLRGEKWGVGFTEILRRYPFPQVALGEYLPEGIVWLDVAKRFKTCAVNEVVRIYYVDAGRAGRHGPGKSEASIAHATGRWHYYIWLLNNDLEYFFPLADAVRQGGDHAAGHRLD